MSEQMNRRCFLRQSAAGLGAITLSSAFQLANCWKSPKKPNLVFVFADQWRAQATGYAGDPNAITPHLDKLTQESVNLSNAISCCPVCSPYRATLMTGQHVLTHGVFYNDKPLDPDIECLADVYKAAGYDTAYIGKWHLNGDKEPGYRNSRRAPVPKERRQGFDFWKVCECTHDYNNSMYYDEEDKKHIWQGYDAFAQTKVALNYIQEHAKNVKPFILFLSWGPPHAPYETAPKKYQDMFEEDNIQLRPNVPEDLKSRARKELAGYYAHIAALDKCIGDLVASMDETGISNNTIFVFTSDHGDMIESQGFRKKQKPWDESIHVPFLLRYPDRLEIKSRVLDMPFGSTDIMPTLLGLSDLPIPVSVEGKDYSQVILGSHEPDNDAVLITCPVPFHQWSYRSGGREYRGVRTRRYTFTRDLNGPWLLYDNQKDPYQLTNLVNNSIYADVQSELDNVLSQKLAKSHDEFLPGRDYMAKWGYEFDDNDL